jgi:hypothetical protein
MSYNPTDNPNFDREKNSGALINNNINELKMLKARRDRLLHQEKEFKELKSELQQIKNLLAKGGLNG